MTSRRHTHRSSTFLTFCLAVLSLGSCARRNLTPINDGCICPGSSLLLNCTTIGAGLSVWLGSIFSGTGCQQFFLSHSQFSPDSSPMFCPGQPFSARPLENIDDRCYVSQFNITNIDNFVGRSVVCQHDTAGRSSIVVGSYTINLTTEPSPPPNDVSLTDISSTGLTFSWTNVAPNCSSIFYNISSSGCGSCPTSTSSTSFVCSGVQLSGDARECNVRVRATTCDNLVGNYSEPFTFTLQVPPAPNVTVLPTYSQNSSSLVSFLVTIFEQAPISISGNDVIVQNYTINYRDSSDTECDIITLRSGDQRCTGVFCRDEVNRMTSPCSIDADSALTVEVVATSILGMGPATTSRIAGSVEGFVKVTANSTDSTISCEFADQPTGGSGQKSCNVTYGRCGETLNEKARGSSGSNVVVVRLELPDAATYCYSVRANNGSFTVFVNGNVSTPGDRPETTGTVASTSSSPTTQPAVGGAVIGGVVGVLFFLIFVVVVILVVSLVFIKLRRQRSVPALDEEQQQNGADSKKALEAEEEGVGGGQTFEMKSATVSPALYENVPVETPNLNTTATSGTEESSLLQTGTLSRPETTGDETLRKLAEKHKKQIPLAIERAEYEETLEDVKKSYWLQENWQMRKVERLIRKVLKILPEQPLFLTVGNKVGVVVVIEGDTTVGEIYQTYRNSEDNQLHIAYSSRDPHK